MTHRPRHRTTSPTPWWHPCPGRPTDGTGSPQGPGKLALRRGETAPAQPLDDRTVQRLAVVTFAGLATALTIALGTATAPPHSPVIVTEMASANRAGAPSESSAILGTPVADAAPVGPPATTAVVAAEPAAPQPIDGSPDSVSAVGRTVRSDGLDDHEVLELIAAALGRELDKPTPDNNRSKDRA